LFIEPRSFLPFYGTQRFIIVAASHPYCQHIKFIQHPLISRIACEQKIHGNMIFPSTPRPSNMFPFEFPSKFCIHHLLHLVSDTRVGTLIVATIYLQLMQNRYMFRSFTVLQCSHQQCVQPVASDVEVVGYL